MSKTNGNGHKPKGHRGEGRTSPRRLDAALRHAQAISLRISGANYAAIADQLGYESAASAYKAVIAELDRRVGEPAEELRRMELSRLDSLMMAVMPQAMTGVLGAVDRVLRIMERRARLCGLDAPQKVLTMDWREEAERAGLNPDEVYEQFVGMIMQGYAKALGDGTGGGTTDG